MRLRTAVLAIALAVPLAIAIGLAFGAVRADDPAPLPMVRGRVVTLPGGTQLVTLADGHVALFDVALVVGPGDDLGTVETVADERRQVAIRKAIDDAVKAMSLPQLAGDEARRATLGQIQGLLQQRRLADVRRVMFSDLATR